MTYQIEQLLKMTSTNCLRGVLQAAYPTVRGKELR